jgi:DNA-binding protein HU-beta
MNRTELVSRVAENTKISKRLIDEVTDELFDTIKDALISEDSVKIRNFGTFKTLRKVARTGVNPRTQESIEIPASVAIKFIAASQVVEELNN